jgi:EmrB/QacA subfamily drug resistance transporter
MQGTPNKQLVLAAMIFAVAMMFIDQTIVAIAIPQLETDLDLTATGAQWIINGYLLSLSALFAFGGKLSDVLGHRRMVLIGVIGFAVASALCGATPTGDIGEPWLIFFRIVQGGFAAVMFPAALAIVVGAYDVRERGKALAIFFAVTGGLTSVGPLAGGFLVEWTWRAIFWINIPIAIIAVLLTFKAQPDNTRKQVPIDYRGTVLVCAGMGLIVLGLQQSSVWGWGSVATWATIVVGLVLMVAFWRLQLRIPDPLIRVRIFADRYFTADNSVLFLMSACFIPIFFFASVYSQLVLGYNASNAGLYLVIFFGGFAAASQLGGRLLDARGAYIPVVAGCAVAAVGFYLWGHQLTDASLDSQWIYIVITGAGMGLVLSPVSTDALNRAPAGSYGEVTGVTQTVRNFGSSLGLAVLGTILISSNRSNLESGLGALGVPTKNADCIADAISSGAGGSSASCGGAGGGGGSRVFDAIQHSYALSTETVFTVMAGIMVAAFIVALLFMSKTVAPQVAEAHEDAEAAEAATAS